MQVSNRGNDGQTVPSSIHRLSYLRGEVSDLVMLYISDTHTLGATSSDMHRDVA